MDAARVYRVGRDPGNDIVIEHGSVSREHCELRVLDDGAVLLADLGSMNGSAVRQNGQWEQIEQATVERDERILLGEIVTTVAALLARAPKTAERAKSDASTPRPRRIPRPTLPAQPEASGLIGRLMKSDWARLNRRSTERDVHRDAPSICLPAIVSVVGPDVAEPEEPARLLRNPPSLRPPPPRPPTRPAAGFGTASNGMAASFGPMAAARAPVDFAALAAAPIMAAAPADVMPAPSRREPSLRANPVSRREAADAVRPSRAAAPAPRHRRRWVPRAGSPEFAKWAVIGSLLLLTSGAAVAAYLKYTPAAPPNLRVAAAPSSAAAARDRDPGDAPGAPPAAKATGKRDPAAATAAARLWQHRIDGMADGAIHAAAAARDGLCLAGVTSPASDGQEAWLIRLETDGSVRWQRRPGGDKRDAALAVAAAGDDGCVAAGYDNDGMRLWIFKLDAKGVLAWSRTVPTAHGGRAVAIRRTRDGGFAVAAYAKSGADGPDRAFVLRLTPAGEIRWSKYAGRGESRATDLRETPDGGFIVAGAARAAAGQRMALWAARLDRNGRTYWEEHYPGPGTPGEARVDVARGSEFIIAATVAGPMPAAGDAPGTGLRLLRIADGGKVIWDRRHTGAARRVAGMVLAPGAIYVAGDSGTGGTASALWLAQFDAKGHAVRESRLPAAAQDRAAALADSGDGRMVLAGTAALDGTGRRGAGIILLDRERHFVAER